MKNIIPFINVKVSSPLCSNIINFKFIFKENFGFINCHIRSYSTNDFITKLEKKVNTMYDKLPVNSVLKHPDSLVAYRITMSSFDVINTLYGLDSNGAKLGIKHFFHIPEVMNVAGIYCFLSKDGSYYYIGSSINMKIRYNRHMFNLKHSDIRYSQANPKFYNYIRKYGLGNLDFGCLLVIKNYLMMFSALNLSEYETSFLKLLIQLDLLITEQFFLDILGLSLNLASNVGTRESSILSDETRKRMSDAHLNLDVTLSEDKWNLIRAKANEAWKNEAFGSDRRRAISELHGKAVIIRDSVQKLIGEFPSISKAGEYLGINRNTISKYLNSGNLLDSKFGPVVLVSKGEIQERANKIQILDENRNLLDTCSSIRATAKKYGIPVSSLSTIYLDKDKLWKGKYYFIKNE